MIKLFVLFLLIFLLLCKKQTRTHTPAEQARVDRTLSKLKRHVEKLKRVLLTKYPTDVRTQRLVKNWSGDLREMAHHENNHAFAYNMNKGEYIAVCMHDRHNRFNDFNALFFVTMHELTHIMTKEYAHNAFFWDSFAWLIGVASDAGLYHNRDYKKNPQRFCNHTINQNPFFA